jgi:Kef-type K+ transport system membrane component KefB
VSGALTAEALGFSSEIGAFLAGVSLARSPIHFFLAEGLTTFRDFFLVFFFFALGAGLDLPGAKAVLLPAAITAMVMLVVKPFAFREIFRFGGEPESFANEIGVRLGQGSEFALLIALLAVRNGQITASTSLYIQVTTLFTMLLSSYIVVFYFPTPFGTREDLKQD